MADISDVENAIVSLLTTLIYPSGIGQPSAVLGDAGQHMPVRIFRGWPKPAALDQDLSPDLLHSLRAGKMNISVFSRGSTEHNTTRFSTDFVELSRSTPTVSATVSGNTVTIGGHTDRTILQYVTILAGPRLAVSYAPTETDTLSSIAAALATLITNAPFGFSCVAVGSVLTLASSAPLVAEVGVSGIQASEVLRTKTEIQITLWCPSPISRDNAAKLIDPTLANTPFLTLADNTICRFRYHNTMVIDLPEKIMLYRRDLIYEAEYLVIVTDTGYQITTVVKNIKGSEGDLGIAPDNVFVQPTTPPTTNPPPQTPLVVQ